MTRRSSLRAQARRNYREGAQAITPAAPTSKQTRLTARVRALYEHSAVPVREIAALAGVTERTIYKYAAKQGWKPRYAWIDRGGVAHRRWRAGANVAPAKGAGGRFIRREDKGKPFARGLKATDRQGAARAAARCRQADELARAAQNEAEIAQLFEEKERAAEWMNNALRALNDYCDERAKERPGRAAPADDPVEGGFVLALQVAIDRWKAVSAQFWARQQAVWDEDEENQRRSMGKS